MSQSSFGDQTAREVTLELPANSSALDFLPADESMDFLSPSQTDLPLPFPSLQNVGGMDSLDTCPSAAPMFEDDIWANAVSNGAMQDLVTPPLTSDRTTRGESEIGFMNLYSRSSWSHMGLDISEKDIFLFINFVESTFSRQYSLHGESSTAEKSWLTCLMFRSSTFFHISLSMSAYQLHIGGCNDAHVRDVAFQNYQTFRDLAIQSYEELKTMPPSIYAERIVCGVHLAHLEALGKNMQSCQSYLERVAQIVVAQGFLLDEGVTNVVGRRQDFVAQAATPKASMPVAQSSQLSGMELRAAIFFAVTFIWNDVLSAAVEGKTPYSADVYRQLFADDGFPSAFKLVAGCEAWVMSTIMDATALEIRKREEVIQGQLSIRELVANADKVEAVVKQEMGRLTVTLNLSESIDDSKAKTEPSNAIQTMIFGHAVLIYLNVIVSGAFTRVPEIHDNIDRAVQVWKLLHPTACRGHLVWAYCTTASLATGSQRLFFRDVAARTSSQDAGIGGLRELAIVVEECWKEMDRQELQGGNSPCDWKEVLKRLNLNMLFV